MPLCKPKENSRVATSMRSALGNPPKYTTSPTFGGTGHGPSVPRTTCLPIAAISSGVTLKVARSIFRSRPQSIMPFLQIEPDVTELVSSYAKLGAVFHELFEDVPAVTANGPRPQSRKNIEPCRYSSGVGLLFSCVLHSNHATCSPPLSCIDREKSLIATDCFSASDSAFSHSGL